MALEQVGTYDPMVNVHGEKLVSLNLERITHYLAKGIKVSRDVEQLLGNFFFKLNYFICSVTENSTQKSCFLAF